MQTKRLLTFSVLCAVLALAGLVIIGCGGGDDDSGSAATSESTATSEAGEGTTTAESGDDSTTTEAESGDDSGGNAPAPSGDAVRSAEVEIEDFAYDPDPVTIEEGGKVIWKNRDAAPHTATADDGSFDTGTIEEDKLKSETFKEPGTYAYICSIHPQMHGTVEVVAAG
jgi:plastocyanin